MRKILSRKQINEEEERIFRTGQEKKMGTKSFFVGPPVPGKWGRGGGGGNPTGGEGRPLPKVGKGGVTGGGVRGARGGGWE